jgi:hypothetical protein
MTALHRLHVSWPEDPIPMMAQNTVEFSRVFSLWKNEDDGKVFSGTIDSTVPLTTTKK